MGGVQAAVTVTGMLDELLRPLGATPVTPAASPCLYTPAPPTRGVADVCNRFLELLPQVTQQRAHRLGPRVQPVTLPGRTGGRYGKEAGYEVQ